MKHFTGLKFRKGANVCFLWEKNLTNDPKIANFLLKISKLYTIWIKTCLG